MTVFFNGNENPNQIQIRNIRENFMTTFLPDEILGVYYNLHNHRLIKQRMKENKEKEKEKIKGREDKREERKK